MQNEPIHDHDRDRLRDNFLSIVIPVFDEEGNIDSLVQRLVETLEKIDIKYEIIFVDDGSRDGTWTRIAAQARKSQNIKGVRLARNFGHQYALWAGLNCAAGDAVISMDGDLQHPPEVIPELVDNWRKGWDIVNTKRMDVAITGAFKRQTSRQFYRVFSYLTDVDLREGTSDFRLLDRRPLDALLGFRDAELFLRGAVQWLGFQSTSVSYEVGRRVAGQSKYNLKRMLRFALTAIVSFSTKPLRIGIWIGLATALLAFAELIYIFVQFSIGNTVPGWASAVGITSLLFGILFVLLGIIGIYLAQIHRALQGRPHFIVASTVGYDKGEYRLNRESSSS